MSMELVNRICPNCKNQNYMVLLGEFSKAYKYKCMNCNRYFNDIDFEEPLQPVWKTAHLNKKIDIVEIVRCKYCKHRPTQTEPGKEGFTLEFPDYICPCQCDDGFYSWYPSDDWFCAYGEREASEQA